MSSFPSVELKDEEGMALALEEARRALEEGEPPVGAVVFYGGKLLSRGRNARETSQDPTAHAEILALRRAADRRQTWRLDGCTVYVTLEPCVMCAGALIASRVDRVVFGAADPRFGAWGSLYDLGKDGRLPHRCLVRRGLRSGECQALIDHFFSTVRARSRRPRGLTEAMERV